MADSSSTLTCTKEIFTAMNSRDISIIEPYLAEHAVFDFPGAGCISGRKRILLFFKVLFRKYPRLTFTVDDIIAEGDRACVVWSNEGEDHKGSSYQNRGITLVRIQDEHIIFISDYFKDTSFVASTG